MKKILFSLLIFFSIISANNNYAQAPDWTKVLQIPTYGNQSGDAVFADDNYAYSAMGIYGSLTFNSVVYTSTGLRDILLIKYDNSGNVINVKQVKAQFGQSIITRAIVVDNLQNAYIVGDFTGSITIGSNTITNDATKNSFVAKFDSNFNGIWATAFLSDGTGFSKISIDGSLNTYIISKSSRLIKFKTTGQFDWQQIYPDKTLQAIGIKDPFLYVGGALQQGLTTLGSFNLNSDINNTGFIARADLNGVYADYVTENSHSYSSKEGTYYALGTFIHPTAGSRPIDLNKILVATEENVLSTSVGDLASSSGSVILTINPADSTVGISGLVNGAYPVFASGINRYDPGNHVFTLNYSYDISGATRVISEVLNQVTGFVKGASAISDISFDNTGNLIIAGGMTNGLAFGAASVVNASSSYYTFFAKCDNLLNFSWIKSSTPNANSNLYNYRVYTDNSNNIYEFGSAPASFNYDAVNFEAGIGHFLGVFDIDGNALAGYPLPKVTDNKAFVNKSGNIFTTGSFDYTGASSFGNFYVEKYFSDLNLAWQKTSFACKSGTFKVNYVKRDPAGNTYVQAATKGYCDYFGNVISGDLSQTIIAKHDTSGVVLWVNVIPDNGIVPSPSQNFSLDKNNNVLKAGIFSTNLSIGSKLFTNQDASDDAYVAKYNTNGSFAWAVQLNATGKAEVYSVTSDADGNVIATGAFNSTITVLGNTIDAAGMEGVFVIKFDPSGNLNWINGFPVGSVVYIATSSTDANKNIYLACDIAGASNGILNFGGVSTPQDESESSVFVKLDQTGNPQWVKSYGGVAGDPSSYSWPCNIKTDAAGNNYVWGWCMNNGVFGTFTLTNPIGTTGICSYYLAKINTNGGVVWAKAIHQKLNLFNYGDLLDIDLVGNLYVGGHFKSTISIDGSQYQPVGTGDFFVAKYSNAGLFQWIKTIPSIPYIISSLSVVNDNALTIGGNAGLQPTMGKFTILVKGGPTSIIANLGSFNPNLPSCDARFEYISGGTYTFQDISIGDPTAWSWDFGDGSYSTMQNPSHVFTKDGVYTVSLTIFNPLANCVSVVKKTIIVGILTCQADFDVAINTETGLADFTSKSSNATDYYWDFGDHQFSTEANPVHTYSKTGVYKACLTILNSATKCQSSACKDVSYIPAAGNYIKADFSFFNDPANLTVSFSDLSSVNTTSWYWTLGDGKVIESQNPVYTYAKAGIYHVCLTATDKVSSLSQTICKDVRVGNIACNIVSLFTYFIDPVAREVSFTSQAQGTINSYFWTFGDGISSTSVNPIHYFAMPGYFKVTLVVMNTTNNCMDKYSQNIQVGSVDCKAGFTSNVTPNSNLVNFTDDSNGQIDYYYWDFGDGGFSVLQSPEHLYKKAGIYMVGQTVLDNVNGCMDFTVQQVQVGEINCAADFMTYIDSSTYTAYFTNRVMGASTALLWSFGDGQFSTVQNPIHKFPGEGIYSAGLNTYDLDNGCMDYYQELLLIGGIGIDCNADFIYNVDPEGLNVSFNNKSIGDVVGSIWNFGDESENSQENDPVHSYSKGGYYNVCLGVVNADGIKNMICKWIMVPGGNSDNCLANFMFSVDSANLKVQFVDNSFGDIDKYSWDFGDLTVTSGNETFKDPSHTYSQKGYYMVKLKVENTSSGCASKEYKLLNVAELQVLKAAFSYEALNPNKKFAGYPVDLVSASSGDGATVEWDFGDKEVKKGSFTVMDSTSRRVTHYYQKPGKYMVCVRISDPINGQSDIYCDWVYTKFGVGIETPNESEFALDVFPNPFTDYTHISYSVAKSQNIELAVFDQLGRRIETIFNGRIEAGKYKIDWHSLALSPGVYHLKLITSMGVVTRQLVIAK